MDTEDYDHTDVDNRPLILFNLYSKSKEPVLTVIRLWDNKIDNLLCAKYFPIHIGGGKVGMNNDTGCGDDTSLASASIGGSTTSSRKLRKRKGEAKDSAIDLKEVMKSITSLCSAQKETPLATNTSPKRKKGIEHMTLDELFQTVDHYKKQLKFLADMEMLSPEEKLDMVTKTKVIFAEIGQRTNSEVS